MGLLLARSPYTQMPPELHPGLLILGRALTRVRPVTTHGNHRCLSSQAAGSPPPRVLWQRHRRSGSGGLGDLSAPATCIGPLPVPPRPAAPQVSGSLSPWASHWASAHSAIVQLTITEPLAPLARQASSLGLSVPTWKMEAMNQGHGGVSLPTSCPLKRAWSQRN